jgi:hypothetical protein
VLPKWVYPTLLLFVVFFVLSNPESAGPQARNFAGWIGDQVGAAGTFLEGLFSDDDSPDQQDSDSNGSDNFQTLGPPAG